MSSVLNRELLEVRVDGPLIVLRIGNAEIRMEHETAIQLSTWLRFRGKEAKRNAGDSTRHWTIVGNLTAVEAGERPW